MALHRLASMEIKLAIVMLLLGGIYLVGAPAVWLLIRVAIKVGAL